MKLTPGIGYFVGWMLLLGGFLLWYCEFASPIAEVFCGLIGLIIALGVFSAYMSARNRP
jgi:hypothetical protein